MKIVLEHPTIGNIEFDVADDVAKSNSMFVYKNDFYAFRAFMADRRGCYLLFMFSPPPCELTDESRSS